MSRHPDLETLAGLAEGSLAPEELARVREHLATCRSCMAAYADAVRYRAAWLARPKLFALPAAGATAIPPDSDPAWTGAPPAARRTPPRNRLVVLAAAGALVVAGTTWFATTFQLPTLQLWLPAAVRESVESSSSRGLVLPGGERGANRPAPTFRSGPGAIPPGLEHEVDSLIASYEHGDRSAVAAARAVAGLLVANDLDVARDYAREGLRRHPDDVRLMVLAADVSYRSNDLERTQDLLGEARRRAPHDPIVALDLAIVIRQRGDTTQANALLTRVATCGVPSLAGRANAELLARR